MMNLKRAAKTKLIEIGVFCHRKFRFLFCKRLCCWLFLFSVPLIFGCALTDDYKPPPVNVPQSWRVNYDSASDLANTAWWEGFGDPVLNGLINEALNKNLDLLIATARVEEAAARINSARSEFYPQLGYGGSISRRQESEELIYPFGTLVDRTNTRYQGFLTADWELDVWGRIRRSTEAARAEYLATESARQAVILTLVSAVASSYLELLGLDEQLKIANETVSFRREWFQLFEKKKSGGQISDLELTQVKSSYEQALTKIPPLEMQIAMLENALSILLGRNPGPIERGNTLQTLSMPGIPAGIPSEVLARRPDLRAMEETLIAANAKVGVARTLYFPSISLTALFGYASSDLSDLFKSSANIWEVGGGLLGPIFTGGRIKSEIEQSEARYTQLLNSYLQTIKNAFKETNDSLISYQQLNELLKEQNNLLGTLKNYNDFSRKSFNAGFTSYLTVLDAEEKLFTAELRQTQTRGELFASLVYVYKAMGGGWISLADKQIVSRDQRTENTPE